jgi:hypothetical protein
MTYLRYWLSNVAPFKKRLMPVQTSEQQKHDSDLLNLFALIHDNDSDR